MILNKCVLGFFVAFVVVVVVGGHWKPSWSHVLRSLGEERDRLYIYMYRERERERDKEREREERERERGKNKKR